MAKVPGAKQQEKDEPMFQDGTGVDGVSPVTFAADHQLSASNPPPTSWEWFLELAETAFDNGLERALNVPANRQMFEFEFERIRAKVVNNGFRAS